MTRIDIISGFLGAGKTTLIKKLLSEALKGEQVVLIENEFGEIGIDGGFLKEAGIEIKEMNSGCICCSLVGDFGTALKEVVDKYHPDRVIIEPSGVGKLSDVIKAVQKAGLTGDVVLNSYTTVADVNKCAMYRKAFGEFFENQIQFAKVVILSRTDTAKATPEKIRDTVDMIKSLNPECAVITTPIDKLDGKKVLETMEEGKKEFTLSVPLPEDEDEDDDECDDDECECHHHHHDHDEDDDGHEHHHHHHHHDDDDEDEHEHHHHHDDDDDEDEHEHHHHHHDSDEDEHEHHHDGDEHEHHHHHGHHHHHHADEVFTSWGTETANKYTREEIEGILNALTENTALGTVLRCKGMVDGADGNWIYFDMVPEECDIRTGSPEITGRFCVIGSKLDEKKLAELFRVSR
ncbi:MAG: GTP-binding protein [Clostridia bacterium]|nr:GTP-binding protein [Clostridia bacterium]